MASRLVGSLAGSIRDVRGKVTDDLLRKAASAGAKVLHDEMQLRVPVDDGVLKGSLYWFHDKRRSLGGKQVYSTGPNMVKAPHWHLVEYGHWRVNVVVRGPNGQLVATKDRLPAPVWVPAVPFIRPSFDAKAQEAVEEARRALSEGLAALGDKA